MDTVDMKEEKTMNTKLFWIGLVLVGALLFASCNSALSVGALRTESQTVELGDAAAVRVEINMGAGDLALTGGAQKLLEADFTYNVAKLKPAVKYTSGKLVVWQPDAEGLPNLRNITNFRNEWNLHLQDKTPMDLRVEMGAGNSHLHLAGLPLTQLAVTLGAGTSTLDLSGDWRCDLDVAIESGAANVSVRLPKDVGVRVEVDAGPTLVDAPGLTQAGNVYTNAAYGVSAVTLQVKLEAGIGWVHLAVAE